MEKDILTSREHPGFLAEKASFRLAAIILRPVRKKWLRLLNEFMDCDRHWSSHECLWVFDNSSWKGCGGGPVG